MTERIQTVDPKNQKTKKTISTTSIISALKELTGKKDKVMNLCSHRTKLSGKRRTIILDCRNCLSGQASITDENCRGNIFQILISEPVADRLVLSHLYERDYEMENLEFLYMLARFIDGIRIYRNAEVEGNPGEIKSQWFDIKRSVIDMSVSDPVKAFIEI